MKSQSKYSIGDNELKSVHYREGWPCYVCVSDWPANSEELRQKPVPWWWDKGSLSRDNEFTETVAGC